MIIFFLKKIYLILKLIFKLFTWSFNLVFKFSLRFIKKYFWQFFFGSLLFLITSISLLTIWSLHSLKSFSQYKFQDTTNYIYDRSGDLIGYTSPKITVYSKLNEFNPRLIKTILLIEDRSFWTNKGFSFSGIFRSVILYIPQRLIGRRPQGGSTVTQQLMRQLYLNDSLSFTRKFKELVISIIASYRISKEEILETYMNRAYFCNNIYGFAAAADVFWGKNTNDLTPDEIAVLVLMLKGPEYSPLRDMNKVLNRRNFILRMMKENNIITEKEYEIAFNKNIEIDLDKFFHLNFLSLTVKNYIIKNFGLSRYEKGGMNIYTTIDKRMQRVCEDALLETCINMERDSPWKGPIGKSSEMFLKDLNPFLEACDRYYSPVIILNELGDFKGYRIKGRLREVDIEKYNAVKKISPGDIVVVNKKYHYLTNIPSFNGQVTVMKNGYLCGDILAYVGGVGLFCRDNIILTPREVASAMKIVDSLIIFEETKHSPSWICPDTPGVVVDNRFHYMNYNEFQNYFNKYGDNKNTRYWPVRNWDLKYFGNTSIRVALEHSRNIPFIKVILEDVGLDTYKDYLIDLEVFKSSDNIYPSTILGCIHASPLIFTEVICGCLNKGGKIQSNLINNICDLDDKIIKVCKVDSTKNVKKIFSPEAIYATLSCMQGCVTRGTGKRLKGTLNNIYVKHGTFSGNRGAVCIAVTKECVIYTTICKNDGSSMGENVWGAGYPVLCIKKIIDSYRSFFGDMPFMPKPKGVSIQKSNYLEDGNNVLPQSEVDEIFFDS